MSFIYHLITSVWPHIAKWHQPNDSDSRQRQKQKQLTRPQTQRSEDIGDEGTSPNKRDDDHGTLEASSGERS
ncbi:hypothetical protein KKG46_01570 [Patescibacteria group bacterium]|nr:hypothetical protein [Patescibacteria group bacterium]